MLKKTKNFTKCGKETVEKSNKLVKKSEKSNKLVKKSEKSDKLVKKKFKKVKKK